ncbi:MAG: metallophosphoesterase [Saprospiraceae bacterium]|nr:metallophosphoesterase [Saprospiraceae bacterium]
MIVFFSVFITVFGLAAFYVIKRTMQSFEGTFVSSTPFLVLFIFLVSAFILGKVIEQASINVFSETLIRIGSVGAAFFIYALFIIIFFDLIRLINFIIPFYPEFITANYQKTKIIIGIISLSLISIVFIAGYINAKSPRVKSIDIAINKKLIEDLNIVAVSDIHLGTMVNKTKALRLVKMINDLNPDIVIIGGDIIDDNIEVVKHNKLLEYLKGIKSKYGVYSCLGNHEYISRAYKELDFFEENGIHMLKDTSVLIDNKFYIIGRDDIQGEGMSNKPRTSLAELTKDLDLNLPVILLDHQPYKLAKTAEFPIDLQFSGHTHSGQFWPINYITGAIFEEDWGYLKKKNTHFYISSGYGTSVAPIRIGNRPEVVNFRVKGIK